MKIYTKDVLPQHLPDGEANPYWLEIRAGKFTASDFHQYMSIVKKGELSDTAESNLYKKALESVGYDFGESTKSAAMEQGTELEPIARQEYIEKTFNDVQEVGFVDWEKLRAGCSPDGVIYDGDNIAKIIEIKCSEIKNYLRMASGKIPPLYITQMQINLLITGAKSCDFVVYHPDMRLVVQEINADKDYQDQIVIALEKLNARYDEIWEEIKRYKK
jgi:putative phage-type endonuclease